MSFTLTISPAARVANFFYGALMLLITCAGGVQAGNSCNFLTRPAIESSDGVTRLNQWHDGAKLCHAGRVHVCENGLWKTYQACDANDSEWSKRIASVLEGTIAAPPSLSDQQNPPKQNDWVPQNSTSSSNSEQQCGEIDIAPDLFDQCFARCMPTVRNISDVDQRVAACTQQCVNELCP